MRATGTERQISPRGRHSLVSQWCLQEERKAKGWQHQEWTPAGPEQSLPCLGLRGGDGGTVWTAYLPSLNYRTPREPARTQPEECASQKAPIGLVFLWEWQIPRTTRGPVTAVLCSSQVSARFSFLSRGWRQASFTTRFSKLATTLSRYLPRSPPLRM